MKDKIAIITGSTSGIGLGIAKKLAKEGANIVLNGFGSAAEITQLQQEIMEQFKVKCIYVAADLTSGIEIENLISQVYENFGRIDVLVNNAGMQFVAPIEEFPAEKWEQVIQLDLIASFYTIRGVVPIMKKQKFGRIINIASAHGMIASPFKSAYVAAKHGLVGLTKTVALEVAKEGITVNAVCPGYVKTPLVINQIKATAKARGISEEEVINNVMLGPQATKRFIEIEEVAEFVAYLCQACAGSITGAALSIDGGWTAQ